MYIYNNHKMLIMVFPSISITYETLGSSKLEGLLVLGLLDRGLVAKGGGAGCRPPPH